jgi:hypothetical protein
VVHSACRVDLSRLDSGALQMVSEPTFAATGACGPGAGHEVHCACRLCGVHGVAYVSALGARSRVQEGTFLIIVCLIVGMLGPTRTSGSLRGCMSHPAQFRIWPIVAHANVMRYCGKFSPQRVHLTTPG